MTPLAVSVTSMSPGVVKALAARLPVVSAVTLALAREKEPSPFRACWPLSPTDRRSRLPAGSMVKGVPWRAKVQEPSRPMWMLGLSRAEAVALLDRVMVTAPELVDRSLVREPATWILLFRMPGPVSVAVAL